MQVTISRVFPNHVAHLGSRLCLPMIAEAYQKVVWQAFWVDLKVGEASQVVN